MKILDWFKKKEKISSNLEQVSNMISIIEKENNLYEFEEDSGRDIKYVFNPLSTEKPPGDAFLLNSPSIPIIKDSANYYINRVLIPIDIKKSELKKIMLDMRNHYLKSNFRQKNRVTFASFRVPGYSINCRLSEEYPTMYEIRYAAKGYPNEH